MNKRRRALAVLQWSVTLVVIGAWAGPLLAETIAWPAAPARARISYVGKRDVSPVMESRGAIAKFLDFIFGGVDQDIPVLTQPSAVGWSVEGDLYVSDLASSRVYRVPSDGSPWVRMGAAQEQPLAVPVGVAVFNDTAFVVDAETRSIALYRADGSLIRSMTTTLQRPVSLCVDAAHMYVVDAAACNVNVLDHDGKIVRTIRGSGGDTVLHTPTNIVRYRDTLFVVDAMNFRVTAVTIDGQFVRSFGVAGDAPGTFSRPRGIAVDPDGHVYVVDGLQDCINVYSRTGEYLMSFGMTGSSGPGQFQLPAGIAINADGLIAVADSHNHCVQLFKYLP